MRKLVAGAVLFSGVLVAAVGGAEEKGGAKREAKEERKDDKREAREERKDDKREAKEERKDAREAARDGGPGASKEAKEKIEAIKEKWKADRDSRRAKERAEVKAKWGPDLKNEALRAELRVHAMRVARLNAMEQVATAAGKDKLLPRIATLREKEQARHERRVQALRAGKDGG